MKRKFFKMTRRQVLKAGLVGGTGLLLPWKFKVSRAYAEALNSSVGYLSDPASQPKFVELAPNALDPAFLFKDLNVDGKPAQKPNFSIRAGETTQETGLINPRNGRRLKTTVWGYGNDTLSWPGQTIQVVNKSAGGPSETVVRWANELRGKKHLLPVDTNLHWCYSLHGDSSANGVDYRQFSIKRDGVPLITHLHGGHSDFQFDGNPEFFYSPDGEVKGPQWDFVDGGFANTFRYDNDVMAGNLWYHDHALGITRLNVYAGLAGFYFVRDGVDTGDPENPGPFPVFPYELAYAIQDRMFTTRGDLFYPAFPDDPFYEGFIIEEEADLPPELFPDGGPTALAEFFGDHMVVNGKIWPKENVGPGFYRMRLLNGCDSRFLVIQFVAVGENVIDPNDNGASNPIGFLVIGSDQGLGTPALTDTLVIEPGGRYDIIFQFEASMKRVIMKNIGYDAPFGGDFGPPDPPDDVFPDRQTDRIMAFDVTGEITGAPKTVNLQGLAYGGVVGNVSPVPVRRVALFEGKDEFGRLQPLLGTVEALESNVKSATAYTWHLPTTENPTVNTTEEWEIYNFTADAHPVHLHLVNFEILGRNLIEFDSDDGDPGQTVEQHNGEFGTYPTITNIEVGAAVNLGPTDGYYETAPKDMVTALPGQVTRIRTIFDKEGRYVWHCHILSHEDHEMMRVLQVEPQGA